MDGAHIISELETNTYAADKREFVQISRAVGVGFIVMGALGYIIKLSTSHHFTQLFHIEKPSDETMLSMRIHLKLECAPRGQQSIRLTSLAGTL